MFNKHKNIAIFFTILVLLPFLSFLINFYADWLFFVETGFPAVFTKTLQAKVGAGLFFAALLFAFAQLNLFFANRAVFPPAGTFITFGNVRLPRRDVLRFTKPLGLLADPLHLSTALWNHTIRQLKDQGLVIQRGEKRGARYISQSAAMKHEEPD